MYIFRNFAEAWRLSLGNKILITLLILGLCSASWIFLSNPGKYLRDAFSERPTPNSAGQSLTRSLTYRQIEDQFNALTDLQRDQYLPTLTGQTVHWAGTVNNVESDGSLDLDLGQRGLFYNVALAGVPKEIGLTLNRGDAVEFDATITKAVRAAGLDITLQYTALMRK